MTRFFSIIVSISEENAHLLPFTLESLASQEEKNFECFLVPIGYIAKQKTERDHRIHNVTIVPSHSFVEGANQALAKAEGTYVHFLTAGEFYLSHKALQILENALVEKTLPSIAYTGQIQRSSFKEPKIWMQRIARRDLMRMNIPTRLHAFLFSRQLLLDHGGFLPQFCHQSAFDLICRVFRASHISKYFLKRVFVDCDYHKEQPRQLLRRHLETTWILWRNFGITYGFFQWIAHNYMTWFHWLLNRLKEAFIKRKILTR